MLEFTGVTKTYHEGVDIHALRTTSLRIDEGEYVAITGPSGSGKSTLLNLLGLLDRPTSGTYRIRGIETGKLTELAVTSLRSRIFGFVFQAFYLLAGRSVGENVQLGMIYRATKTKERHERAMQALRRVGLDGRYEADPRNLSGGERQRVAIARALAAGPAVLLCDEPTGNLDSVAAADLMDLLDGLNAAGQTVVVVTHNPSVAAHARRVLAVEDGAVTEAEW